MAKAGMSRYLVGIDVGVTCTVSSPCSDGGKISVEKSEHSRGYDGRISKAEPDRRPRRQKPVRPGTTGRHQRNPGTQRGKLAYRRRAVFREGHHQRQPQDAYDITGIKPNSIVKHRIRDAERIDRTGSTRPLGRGRVCAESAPVKASGEIEAIAV